MGTPYPPDRIAHRWAPRLCALIVLAGAYLLLLVVDSAHALRGRAAAVRARIMPPALPPSPARPRRRSASRDDIEHPVQAAQSFEMVMRVGQGGQRRQVSPASLRLLGYRPDELIGLRWTDCVHPDDIRIVSDGWEASGSHPVLMSYRLRRKDGSYMWAEASMQLSSRSPAGCPERLVVVRDIDERVAAEHALRRSEARYRLLSEHARDMMFRLDMNLVRHDVSPASLDILGYHPEELNGEHPPYLIHPDDSLAAVTTLRAMLAGQDRGTNVGRVRHRQGHWVWVEVSLRLVRDGEGRPEGIIGVLRDITARRAAEASEAEALARLRRTNDMLLQAEAMTHLGHWHLVVATEEVIWSDEIFHIYGWPRSRVPTLQTAIDGYHEDDRGEVQCRVERAIAAREPFRFDLRIVRPDGEVRHVTSHGRPEFDASGNLVAIMGTFQDVTERTLLEQELRHSQQMKTLGVLAAGVAHDFNNLLQAIMGSLELICDGIDGGSPLHRFAGIALASAERGSHLTHHLLSYARRQVLQPRVIEPASLLTDLQLLLAHTLGPHISVQTRVRPDVPPIVVDPAHLQTALINLGINAGHAMPTGGTLVLEASAEAGKHGETFLVLAVIDTGIGMSDAIIAQAFDPFFTTKGLGGTGLGLSMVHGFARQSGGDVRLASEIGRGTRVELRLPAADVTHAAVPCHIDTPHEASAGPLEDLRAEG